MKTVIKNFSLEWFYCLTIFLVLNLFSCGSEGAGTTQNNGMGSYQARLVFPPDVARVDSSDSSVKAIEGGIDCDAENIATVTCSLYASDNTFLVSDSWPCSQRAGVVNGVSPGSGITVVVTASNSDRVVLFRGVEHDVVIEANQQTVGGEIEMVASDDLDLDGDGYASVSDCDDDDPASYPGALDPSGNDIDENCDGIDGIVESFTIDDLGMEFVLIPAGTFTMGSPEDELTRGDDEILHQVTLTRYFFMQTTEVTQDQWAQVGNADTGAGYDSYPSYFINCGGNCPVEDISFYDVESFITSLNKLYPGQFECRLPTEAEWEYAARAESQDAFAEGDITETECGLDTILEEMGWYCFNSAVDYTPCIDNSDNEGAECAGVHPVQAKTPNAYGLYDMHGNVWEWCQDWYGSYSTSAVEDPTGPATGSDRVIRGGSWINTPGGARSAQRNSYGPGDHGNGVGFRLVCLPISK